MQELVAESISTTYNALSKLETLFDNNKMESNTYTETKHKVLEGLFDNKLLVSGSELCWSSITLALENGNIVAEMYFVLV